MLTTWTEILVSKNIIWNFSRYLHSDQLLWPGVWTAVQAFNIRQLGEKILKTLLWVASIVGWIKGLDYKVTADLT